jgi:hypothetical protein
MRKMLIERPSRRYRTPMPTSTGQIVAHNTARPPDQLGHYKRSGFVHFSTSPITSVQAVMRRLQDAQSSRGIFKPDSCSADSWTGPMTAWERLQLLAGGFGEEQAAPWNCSAR